MPRSLLRPCGILPAPPPHRPRRAGAPLGGWRGAVGDGRRAAPVVACSVAVEVCSYRLTLKGKPVGTHELKTLHKGRVTLLEGRAQYQGALGTSSVVQRSRCSRGERVSQRFREEWTERSGQRTFDVVFDPEDGLVTASHGRDQANAPYLLPYRDPLSMLLELRELGPREHAVLPLLGKEVTVQRAGEVELDTSLGTRNAVAYLLHPGGSVVYVDRDAPHLLLKFTQRLNDGFVDALLIKVGEEDTLDDFAPSRGSSRRGSGKRRRRSRRRRPRRNKRRDG